MARKASRVAERFVYGSVLDALGQGLYPDKHHVIREFVQNACDAVREYDRHEGSTSLDPVEIKLQPPSVTIFDRGIGMSRKKMEEYRYVGFSEKEPEQNVGFRGIGTISGIAVASKMVVTSSRVGVGRRYTVVIDADGMLQRMSEDRNPALEELLDEFTDVTQQRAPKDEHFTLVELHGIREDSQELYDAASLLEHLRRGLPVPFDPDFSFGSRICQRLRMNVSDYFEAKITLNGTPLYKPFLAHCQPPEFETVFLDDNESSAVLAFCWCCKHALKGQFSDKRYRGLTYRLKNFMVGTPQQTRDTLWHSTPERAFYYFGEIHLLDKGLVPSSDRTQFEDNAARKRMYDRCRRVARVLNLRAGVESERQRFGSALDQAEEAFREQERKLKRGEVPAELQDEVQYGIRRTLEDVQKRLRRARGKKAKTTHDTELIERGRKVQRKGKSVLRRLSNAASAGELFDVTKAVRFGREAKGLYSVVVEVLREELRSQPRTLERILKALQTAIADRLG